MAKYTRYQGAIVRNGHVLLLQQTEHATGRSYWLLPGGKKELGETEQQCVQREMLEETGLRVRVGELLLDEPITWGDIERQKIYQCSAVSGEPRPGYEPEEAYATMYSFTGVQWLDLKRPAVWAEDVLDNPTLYALLMRIRAALGCTTEAADPNV